MQEWLHMAGGHNKVEYCSGPHLKESSFRSIDLSLALALSLTRGPRRIVGSVRGVLGHLLEQAKLRFGQRVGNVHLTHNEVVPLRNTNRSYAWLVGAAVARHS